MIFSSDRKEFCGNEAFKAQFLAFEGEALAKTFCIFRGAAGLFWAMSRRRNMMRGDGAVAIVNV